MMLCVTPGSVSCAPSAAAAARNDVTGWVRNLSDGRVELVAEGEHPELEAFQDAVPKAGLRWLVRSATEDWGKGTGEFRGFEITG